jgi:hypothetical protein
VRLRPVGLARGGNPSQRAASGVGVTDGPGQAGGEAGGEEKHAPVRDDQKGKRRRRFAAALTLAGGLPDWLPGRVFAAVTQAPALAAVAWLVPGTALLLTGRLAPRPTVIVCAALAVTLCYFAMRRLPASWPGAGASGESRGVPAGALLAMVAVAAGFGLWQAVFRSEQVFVVSDPGVYLQYGYWIAAHGTAHIPVSAAAFGGAPGLSFASTGFAVSGNSVTPSFLPGLPLVLAGGTWLGGLGGALLMPAVLGGCAVLSFGGLAGRLCGGWWGVAAELVLAVSLPEVYTARTPLAEPLVQVLLFGGLCLFIDSLALRGQSRGGGLALAGLGGLALGLTVLASIGSLGLLLPVFPVLGVLFVARRAQAGPFGLGLLAGIGLGLASALVLARAYLAAVAPQLHLIGLCAAGTSAAAVLAAPLALPGVRSRMRRAFAFNVRFPWFKGEKAVLPSLGGVAQWLALVLPVAVLVGLAERPYLQVVRGQTDPAVISAVAALQHAERLPVDGSRQYYESSLYWVMWYLGAPALLLACTAASAVGRRVMQAVLAGRSAAPWSTSPAVRLWGLPFLLVGWSVVTVLWDPVVVPWQPFASHRLVPAVLPGIILLAVWMSRWLAAYAAALGASRAAVSLVGGCCVLALAIPALVTTLNPVLAARPSVGQYSSGISKLASRVQLRGVGASATYRGSLSAASALCAAIGSSASVLFTDSSTAAAFGPAVRELCGQPAALVDAAPSPGLSATEIEQAVTSVERTGWRPVLLGATRSAVSLPGTVPRQVVSLRTAGDDETLTGAPAGTQPVTYSVWLSVPSGGEASQASLA